MSEKATTSVSSDEPTRERLIQVGAEQIAQKGFGGASIREICAAADTSSNMIHHYFGDKAGLLQAILDRCGEQVFAGPMRLLDPPITSAADFTARFRLLFLTTLDACIDNRWPLMVALREQANLVALVEYQHRFVEFLNAARTAGWVRLGVDPAMISGATLDRITNYVFYAPWQSNAFGIDVLTDTTYRDAWLSANVDLYLHGLVSPAE